MKHFNTESIFVTPRKWLLTAAMLLSLSCHAQTIAEVEAEIRRQGLPHPGIVLAQARLETGNFKSTRCRRDHNLFGIKHNGKYTKYRTWQESVVDYKKCISSRYKGGDYYQFLRRIGYASDKAYTNKLNHIIKTSN